MTKLLTPPNNEWKHIISYRLTSSMLSKCQQHTALDTSCYVIVANHLILLSCILVIACKRSHDCYTMLLFSEKSKRLKYASSWKLPVHPMHPTYQQLLWCIFFFVASPDLILSSDFLLPTLRFAAPLPEQSVADLSAVAIGWWYFSIAFPGS